MTDDEFRKVSKSFNYEATEDFLCLFCVARQDQRGRMLVVTASRKIAIEYAGYSRVSVKAIDIVSDVLKEVPMLDVIGRDAIWLSEAIKAAEMLCRT